MDRLMFGDNQFFGINHMSEEKARTQALQFRELDAVLAVLDAAYLEGIRTFMCTTHDRIASVCDHVAARPDRYADFNFYPGLPYAHKYANAATDAGLIGAIRRFLPSEGLIDAAVRGGRSLATRDIDGIATLLIDAELKMFEGVSTPVIFLQNVVVDLLLGLGATGALRTFADHVRERYGSEPGFITMNLPVLLGVLEQLGLTDPIVCTNINKLGFRMSGGVDAYERALREYECRVIAMSVYASGAIPAQEAIDWVCSLPNVRSIVFGASTRSNIRSTVALVGEHWDLSTHG